MSGFDFAKAIKEQNKLARKEKFNPSNSLNPELYSGLHEKTNLIYMRSRINLMEQWGLDFDDNEDKMNVSSKAMNTAKRMGLQCRDMNGIWAYPKDALEQAIIETGQEKESKNNFHCNTVTKENATPNHQSEAPYCNDYSASSDQEYYDVGEDTSSDWGYAEELDWEDRF